VEDLVGSDTYRPDVNGLTSQLYQWQGPPDLGNQFTYMAVNPIGKAAPASAYHTCSGMRWNASSMSLPLLGILTEATLQLTVQLGSTEATYGGSHRMVLECRLWDLLDPPAFHGDDADQDPRQVDSHDRGYINEPQSPGFWSGYPYGPVPGIDPPSDNPGHVNIGYNYFILNRTVWADSADYVQGTVVTFDLDVALLAPILTHPDMVAFVIVLEPGWIRAEDVIEYPSNSVQPPLYQTWYVNATEFYGTGTAPDGASQPQLTLNYQDTPSTKQCTGRSGDVHAQSRVDECFKCGTLSLREKWIKDGWTKRLVYPDCYDPPDPLEDRRPVISEGPGLNEEES
jgi:hypothetical protein